MQREFIDQMGRSIQLNYPPKRIISLVPSQTELLFYLGLTEEVVGITKFCIHPEEQFRTKKRVGGTKKYDFDRIKALQPDLIIGNKEENEKEQIEQLAIQYPIWMSDIKTLEDAFQMIVQVGILVDKAKEAKALVQILRAEYKSLQSLMNKSVPKTAAYLIWRKPYLVAASDTFINELLPYAGFKNVFDNKTRYPEVTIEEIAMAQPDSLLLSSEPYPFKAEHIEEFKEACPNSDICLVDGEAFSWYGNRLLHSSVYFRKLRESFKRI